MVMAKQRIFIAGHNGMVGSALVRQLDKNPEVQLVVRNRSELNLLDQQAVQQFFKHERKIRYTWLLPK